MALLIDEIIRRVDEQRVSQLNEATNCWLIAGPVGGLEPLQTFRAKLRDMWLVLRGRAYVYQFGRQMSNEEIMRQFAIQRRQRYTQASTSYANLDGKRTAMVNAALESERKEGEK